MVILKIFCGYLEKSVHFIINQILHLSLNDEKIYTLIQFIKFGIVGISNTFVHYIIYLLCAIIGINYILANFIAFSISVINSFYWNNKYVFKLKSDGECKWLSVLIKTYISYAITGLLLNSILLYIEIDIWGINEFVAPIINMIVTIPLNFIINKFWAYKSKK